MERLRPPAVSHAQPPTAKETACLGICIRRRPNIMSKPQRLIGRWRSSTAATITPPQSSNRPRPLKSPNQLTSIRPRRIPRASSRRNLPALRNNGLDQLLWSRFFTPAGTGSISDIRIPHQISSARRPDLFHPPTVEIAFVGRILLDVRSLSLLGDVLRLRLFG